MNARFSSYLVIVFTAILFGGCTAGHQIRKLPDPPGSLDQAAYYALPRTVVAVTFPVEATSVKEGTGTTEVKGQDVSCFSQLGEHISFKDKIPPWVDGKPKTLLEALGFAKKPDSSKANYSVKDGVTVATLAEPDPEQIFRVELDSSWAKKRALTLEFGPLGVLQSGTSSVQDRRVDLAVAFAKSALQLSSSAGLFSFRASNVSLHTSNLGSGSPEELLCGEVKGKCQQTACEIYRARIGLARLPYRVTEQGLEADQATWLTLRFEADIDKLMPVFVRPKKVTGEIVCALRPKAPTQTNAPIELLKLDPAAGFSAATGTECLIPVEFEGTGSGPVTVFQAEVKVPNQYSQALKAARLDKAHDPTKDQGFYYRIPAVAEIDILKGSKRIATSQEVVAQLGLVAALPRQSTYQTKYVAKLDPATGALVSLTSDSEAIDPSLITGTSEAISSALEARAEAKEKEAAANDELALLERQRKLLEERDKIRELEKKLAAGGGT